MKLYFARRTRATRPRWLLEELGVPYEKINLELSKGEHKSPEYLAVHPLGVVPALVDGEVTLFESVAICLYLADKYLDRGLAPAHGTPARAQYYQWMVFAAATLEPAVADYSAHTSYLPEAERRPAVAEAARARFVAAAEVVSGALGARSTLVGERFTAADVIVGSILLWAGSMGLLAQHPTLEAYTKTLRARPAWARAQA
jgi:glutathione S-transferase